MEPLKISVIVPVYNVEEYLHQCLDSICNQTYKNLEILVIDDGSPDKCPEICDEYAKRDNRIKVLHQKNSGLSAARNLALDIAKGEYIAFVDSDDYLEKDTFSLLIDFMEAKSLDAAFMGLNVVENGKVSAVRNTYFPNGTTISPLEITYLSLIDEIGGQAWARLCKKHLWENVRFPEGRIYEDLAISYLPFLNATQNIGFLDKPLYNYRMNPNGISFTYKAYKNYHIFLGFREHYEYAAASMPKASSICLAKTAIFALGTFHASLLDTWNTMEKDISDVCQFLEEHKKEIKASPHLNKKYKFLFLFYFALPKVYAFFIKTVNKFLGRNR